MDRRLLRKLQRNKEFRRYLEKNAIHKKKNTLLILILLAIIVYLIFTKANLYLIIGLTVLLVLIMR